MIKEIWMPVVGYEGLYEVSNIGRVRSLWSKTRIKDKEGKILRQKDNGKGYYSINLHKDGICRTVLVHRLVADAFIPKIDGLDLVGHLDDNKKNNVVENLYWTDYAENNRHNGKLDRFQRRHREKMAQIIEAISTPIICKDVDTGEERWFPSMQEAARVMGAESGKISMCCNGIRKHHRNKSWRFDDAI